MKKIVLLLILSLSLTTLGVACGTDTGKNSESNTENESGTGLVTETETETETQSATEIPTETEMKDPERPDRPNNLTSEKLAWFETQFFNVNENRIVNMFLNCLYQSPKEIDVHEVFEDGCYMEVKPTVTDQEKELLETRHNAMTNFGLHKIPVAEVNNILQKYAKIKLKDVDQSKLSGFYYLEEYDAYYQVAGDFNCRDWNILDGWTNEDGTITLVYQDKLLPTEGASTYQVTLGEENGSYYFLSNVAQ